MLGIITKSPEQKDRCADAESTTKSCPNSRTSQTRYCRENDKVPTTQDTTTSSLSISNTIRRFAESCMTWRPGIMPIAPTPSRIENLDSGHNNIEAGKDSDEYNGEHDDLNHYTFRPPTAVPDAFKTRKNTNMNEQTRSQNLEICEQLVPQPLGQHGESRESLSLQTMYDGQIYKNDHGSVCATKWIDAKSNSDHHKAIDLRPSEASQEIESYHD